MESKLTLFGLGGRKIQFIPQSVTILHGLVSALVRADMSLKHCDCLCRTSKEMSNTRSQDKLKTLYAMYNIYAYQCADELLSFVSGLSLNALQMKKNISVKHVKDMKD